MCVASGDFINDDGVALNLTAVQNIYHFSYLQDLSDPDHLNLTVTMSANATQYDASTVNSNDLLASLEIYNAAA